MFKPLFGTLALLAAFSLAACNPQSSSGGMSGQVTTTGKANIGGAYTLVNQDGETVTDADFLGRPQLIYFGFSFCPDVCPLALQQIGAAQKDVDPDGKLFQPIFISVDPERDTPESLKLYVTANGFPKNLVGLTGSLEQVETAKKAYKVYAQKVEDPSATGEYTVDHVSLIFLMNDKGEFVDVFTHNTSVPEIIKRLKLYKKRGR